MIFDRWKQELADEGEFDIPAGGVPLCMATREEILEELGRRYRAYVLVTDRLPDDARDDYVYPEISWSGYFYAAGLLEHGRQLVSQLRANNVYHALKARSANAERENEP